MDVPILKWASTGLFKDILCSLGVPTVEVTGSFSATPSSFVLLLFRPYVAEKYVLII